MKMYFTKTKIALIFSLILLSFSSCSDSDDLEGSKPFLEVTWGNIGSSLNLESRGFNVGGEFIIDLYLNDELINSEILTTGGEAGNSYWESIYLDNTVNFPISIYIVVKEGGAKVKSNEVVIEDPILGKKLLRDVKIYDKLEEKEIPVTLTNCQKLSTIEFLPNNYVNRNWFDVNSSTGECEEQLEEFQWERVGINKYKFIFDQNFYLVDMIFGYDGKSLEFEVLGNRYDRIYYYEQ
ncbi:hypothetical protein VBY74_02255 [Tenacibaculum ascidiaceicola]|uniref:hypothetical protein n=1 Tax=Tenacibaculum TaxID=104267 RepID=UPI0039EC026D